MLLTDDEQKAVGVSALARNASTVNAAFVRTLSLDGQMTADPQHWLQLVLPDRPATTGRAVLRKLAFNYGHSSPSRSRFCPLGNVLW